MVWVGWKAPVDGPARVARTAIVGAAWPGPRRAAEREGHVGEDGCVGSAGPKGASQARVQIALVPTAENSRGFEDHALEKRSRARR